MEAKIEKKEKRERPEGRQQTDGGDVDADREQHGLRLRAYGVKGLRKKRGRK